MTSRLLSAWNSHFAARHVKRKRLARPSPGFCVLQIMISDSRSREISEMIGGEFAGIPVLLIEDDKVLRRAMEELLDRWGMKVAAASSEAEALMMIDRSPPRLIIADYSLRGSLGTEVVGLISSSWAETFPL